MDLVEGDKIQIDHPTSDKHGLTGTVTTLLNNGAVVRLDRPFNLERPFTPVKSQHLKKI